MVRAYVQLACPSCSERWEADPAELPSPKAEFECPHCGATRHLAEFARTQRDLEIMKEL